MKDFNIKDETKKLPETPGVYLMHNETDEIIYVGKAVNLKGRVSQYFYHNENRQNRIQQMVANIRWFEVIEVHSELEALVLESNLIKEYRPRYNSALRNDENHPYLKIDRTETYPRIIVTTENVREDAFYIGPFYKSMEVEQAVSFISKYYGLRTCSKKLKEQTSDGHPCMYYSLGQCMGPCRGSIPEQDYEDKLARAIHFFATGDDQEIKEELQSRMLKDAEQLAFEKAAVHKRQLLELEEISQKITFTRRNPEDSVDLFAIARDEKEALILLYLIRNRRLSGRDLFRVNLSGRKNCSEGRILRDFLQTFYEGSPYIPSRLILTEQIPEKASLEQMLLEKKRAAVSCLNPRTGENGRLAKMAKKNAENLLLQQKDSKSRSVSESLDE